MYFSREKSIKVYKNNNNEFTAFVTFIDEYHDFEMIIETTNDLIVKNSEVKQKKMPYETCKAIFELVKKMNGIKIESGLTKKTNDLIGKNMGCVHMVDMFLEAARGLVQAKLKYVEETYGIDEFYKQLEGSCISYTKK